MRELSEMNNENNEVMDLANKIVELVHPLNIILFGSTARGENDKDSDIDLLIVMPEGTHRRKTAQRIYKEVVDIKIPFDVIIVTLSDLEKNRGNIGLFYRTALNEGKEIYAA
jgi:uncharacterized protein